MRHEIRRYFDFWLDFYKVPQDRRSKIYIAINDLFEVFDEEVGPKVQSRWKENRHSNKSV